MLLHHSILRLYAVWVIAWLIDSFDIIIGKSNFIENIGL